MFIKVNIDNLKEYSKLIPFILNREIRIIIEKMKINIVKKYLFISLVLKLILLKNNLFIKIFLGLLKDKIWLIEYLNNEYIFINLRPELVEKKEPPIITKIRKIKVKLDCFNSSEKPIFDILLEIDKRLFRKSLLKLKNNKNIEIITIK